MRIIPDRPFWYILILTFLFYVSIVFDTFPFQQIMAWRYELQVNNPKVVGYTYFESIDLRPQKTGVDLQLEIIAGTQFWYPQIAIWIEDSEGNYLETLMVTESTAKGRFYSGRTKKNYKYYDANGKSFGTNKVRVDPLPYWSHKRGVLYGNGFYSPNQTDPLPDAISGATASSNFILHTKSIRALDEFRLMLEINVAFDDNEYFSEYDFPNDSIYHGGTGQLGQPSLVYSADLIRYSEKQHYVLNPIGHGHPSAQNGVLYQDLSKLTTAMDILERIIVKVN